MFKSYEFDADGTPCEDRVEETIAELLTDVEPHRVFRIYDGGDYEVGAIVAGDDRDEYGSQHPERLVLRSDLRIEEWEPS